MEDKDIILFEKEFKKDTGLDYVSMSVIAVLCVFGLLVLWVTCLEEPKNNSQYQTESPKYEKIKP